MNRLSILCSASLLALSFSSTAFAQYDEEEDTTEVEEPGQPASSSTETPPVAEPPPPPPPPAPPPTSYEEEEEEEVMEQRTQMDEDSPVVRAQADNLGMFFRFGGLATLDAGSNTRDVNGLLISQVGLKFVLSERSMIPIYLGTGFRLTDTTGPSSAQTDWGFEFGGAYEYHFRIWNRISPFIAGNLGFGITDPTGTNNLVFGMGLGPSAGIEYYVADRVSLTAQYYLLFAFDISPDRFVAFAWNTLAGGALNLTFYF